MQGPSSGYAASIDLLNAATATGAGAAKQFNHSVPYKACQATVTGTGAVTATVKIEVSNDNAGWITAGTITLSGTTTATDGFAIQSPWLYVRANVTALTGTNAAVTVEAAV